MQSSKEELLGMLIKNDSFDMFNICMFDIIKGDLSSYLYIFNKLCLKSESRGIVILCVSGKSKKVRL